MPYHGIAEDMIQNLNALCYQDEQIMVRLGLGGGDDVCNVAWVNVHSRMGDKIFERSVSLSKSDGELKDLFNLLAGSINDSLEDNGKPKMQSMEQWSHVTPPIVWRS